MFKTKLIISCCYEFLKVIVCNCQYLIFPSFFLLLLALKVHTDNMESGKMPCLRKPVKHSESNT